MKLYLNDIIYAVSQALDAVEFEFFGAADHHAQRVALLSVRLMKQLQENGAYLTYQNRDLIALAGAAAMHDNGLTAYYRNTASGRIYTEAFLRSPHFRQHCVDGEENLKVSPFYGRVKDVLLYHHETADGSGPFGKRSEEIPLFARLIHFADTLDILFPLAKAGPDSFNQIRNTAKRFAGNQVDSEIAEVFLDCFQYEDCELFRDAAVEAALFREVPEEEAEVSFDTLRQFAALVAKITDYKSTFTSSHSRGIAEKAERMGVYYKLSGDACAALYVAGAFHDIGKLYVPTEILEKPGRLTAEEFEKMKYHALASYNILGKIRGIGDLRHWAAFHHEKLDGSGYPFGLTGDALDFNDRLLACIDIYQALTEYRPYRQSNTHAEAIAMLRENAAGGKIDGSIVEDINLAFQE